MNYFLLGIVQGLTEFLPVSSQAHLMIVQRLFALPENLAFDTVVHLATALALIAFFWRDILDLFRLRSNHKLLGLIVVATFFTGIIGLSFKDFFESLFGAFELVGPFLIVTGLVIILGEYWGKGRRGLKEMNIWDATLIGLAQGAAIIPALSRSATTISVSLARDLERPLAARFSFLIAIPAILGAGLIQSKAIVKAGTLGIGFWPLALGFIAAFFSGLLALKLFMGLIQRTSIRGYAYYCFVAGFLVLLLSVFVPSW